MTEIPEHLLKRAQAARDKSAEAAPAASEPVAESPAQSAPADSRIPEALLQRSKAAKAAKAGGTADEAPASGGAVAVADKVGAVVAAPAAAGGGVPVGAGPGGHTQRLLTVVKSGSIQDVKATPVDKVHTWPHLLAAEFVASLAMTAFVFIFSVFVHAPLLQLANTNQTPNPSKAPWYFVGLQELLVYFDPWIAGVLLPGIIIGGLCAIPYLDTSKKGIGYYTWSERPFANAQFMFGIAFWFILITIGYFFRGPNYFWYWPWESWLVHKPVSAPTWSFSLPVGVTLLAAYGALGMTLPRLIKSEICWRKASGAFLGLFALVGLWMKFGGDISTWRVVTVGVLLYLTFLFGFLYPQRYIRDLDLPRYTITQALVLMQMGVLVKMGLRLGLDVKYILELPQFNLNI